MRRAATSILCISLLSTATPVRAAPPADAVASDTDAPSVWDTLIEHRVALVLIDGHSVRGTVLSASDDTLVCARAQDGLLIAIDTGQIALVQVVALPDNKPLNKPENGRGLIVVGSILVAIGTGLGVATLTTGGVCFANHGDVCGFLTLPLTAVGLVSLSLGIPFLASGVHKRKQLRIEQRTSPWTMSAIAGVSRDGAMLGVGLRF